MKNALKIGVPLVVGILSLGTLHAAPHRSRARLPGPQRRGVRTQQPDRQTRVVAHGGGRGPRLSMMV